MSEKKCANCGSVMVMTGSAAGRQIFHCKCCGHDDYVEISQDGASAYAAQRAQLLNRVAQSVLGTAVGQWDYLYRDVLDFMGNYEEARRDAILQMAVAACITRGFSDMDSKKYRETKAIFKLTEKMYKSHLKAIKLQGKGQIKDVGQYEDYRIRYKKIRNEYRNTKLMWKIAYSLGKMVIKGI